ncbi:MAG: biotin--[acetyl-CoA-carboxylase] ligase [Spirochaetaceae bacterium 4572_59]|nr:MAG: biotin--[acetyl-CoA-carboxylase] ligase [Spirochaetaceae bacterium 4572_59]
MKEAAKRQEQQKEDNFIILAEHQSGGIARNEQSWDSPDGGIYMTCMINRSLPLEMARKIPLYGILTVLQTLGESGVSSLGYRLPGDILIKESKVGGILEEYHVRGDRICWYALGIGIHINDSFKKKEQNGMTSVVDKTGIQLMRKDFMHHFRENWKKALLLKSDEIESELKQYKLK